jgi:hypothetical protein
MSEFDKNAFKKAIGQVESSGGKMLSNTTSSAAGTYHFLYNNIRHLPELKGMSKIEFMKDTKLQEQIMDRALNGTLEGYPNYVSYSKKLKAQFNSEFSNEELAALTHLLGMGGVKKYLGNTENFKVPGKNASAEQYVDRFRKAFLPTNPKEDTLFDANPIERQNEIKQNLAPQLNQPLDNIQKPQREFISTDYKPAEGATNDSLAFLQGTELALGGEVDPKNDRAFNAEENALFGDKSDYMNKYFKPDTDTDTTPRKPWNFGSLDHAFKGRDNADDIDVVVPEYYDSKKAYKYLQDLNPGRKMMFNRSSIKASNTRALALGGNIDYKSGGGVQGLIEFSEGDTHEKNAYGGIPIGGGSSVEENETMVKLGGKDYVFSDRIGMYNKTKK